MHFSIKPRDTRYITEGYHKKRPPPNHPHGGCMASPTEESAGSRIFLVTDSDLPKRTLMSIRSRDDKSRCQRHCNGEGNTISLQVSMQTSAGLTQNLLQPENAYSISRCCARGSAVDSLSIDWKRIRSCFVLYLRIFVIWYFHRELVNYIHYRIRALEVSQFFINI